MMLDSFPPRKLARLIHTSFCPDAVVAISQIYITHAIRT